MNHRENGISTKQVDPKTLAALIQKDTLRERFNMKQHHPAFELMAAM